MSLRNEVYDCCVNRISLAVAHRGQQKDETVQIVSADGKVKTEKGDWIDMNFIKGVNSGFRYLKIRNSRYTFLIFKGILSNPVFQHQLVKLTRSDAGFLGRFINFSLITED